MDTSEGDLSEMINIGKNTAEKLKLVGIKSPKELISIGSENAFIRLQTIDSGACINLLYALEGAVQGIRWHNLDKNKKNELFAFYNLIQNSNHQ